MDKRSTRTWANRMEWLNQTKINKNKKRILATKQSRKTNLQFYTRITINCVNTSMDVYFVHVFPFRHHKKYIINTTHCSSTIILLFWHQRRILPYIVHWLWVYTFKWRFFHCGGYIHWQILPIFFSRVLWYTELISGVYLSKKIRLIRLQC